MAHTNEDLIRRGYDAFSSGDMQTVDELLADDVVWHIPGRSTVSGDYRGKQDVIGFFGKLIEMTGGTFKLEVHDVLANDEHGVVLVRATAERDGKTFDDRGAQVLHIEGGKVKEFWGHGWDHHAADEFWS